VQDEFEAMLSLEGEQGEPESTQEEAKSSTAPGDHAPGQQKYPWLVLGLQIFIAPDKRDGTTGNPILPPPHVQALRERLQQRMALAAHPLEELYVIMRKFPFRPEKLIFERFYLHTPANWYLDSTSAAAKPTETRGQS
jgi:hypothetical protein